MSKRPSLSKVGLSAASIVAIAAAVLGASPAKADTASGSFAFTSQGGAISAYAGEVDSPGFSFSNVTVAFQENIFFPTGGLLTGTLTVTPGTPTPLTGNTSLRQALDDVFGAGQPVDLDAQLAVFDAVAESGYLD